MTLYRVIQHHLEEFIRTFKWALISRDEFDRWLRVPPDTLTDIQRSARFFYLQKMGFGGRIVNPSFAISTTRGPRLNLLRIEEDLSAAHLRLARVFMENLPYADVITRYDRPSTVFYLDPPYWGARIIMGRRCFRGMILPGYRGRLRRGLLRCLFTV